MKLYSDPGGCVRNSAMCSFWACALGGGEGVTDVPADPFPSPPGGAVRRGAPLPPPPLPLNPPPHPPRDLRHPNPSVSLLHPEASAADAVLVQIFLLQLSNLSVFFFANIFDFFSRISKNRDAQFSHIERATRALTFLSPPASVLFVPVPLPRRRRRRTRGFLPSAAGLPPGSFSRPRTTPPPGGGGGRFPRVDGMEEMT